MQISGHKTRAIFDRYNIVTKQTQRLFQCDDDHYETVEALLDAKGDKFLTKISSAELVTLTQVGGLDAALKLRSKASDLSAKNAATVSGPSRRIICSRLPARRSANASSVSPGKALW